MGPILSPILGPILSPILGPVQGLVHVLYYAQHPSVCKQKKLGIKITCITRKLTKKVHRRHYGFRLRFQAVSELATSNMKKLAFLQGLTRVLSFQ